MRKNVKVIPITNVLPSAAASRQLQCLQDLHGNNSSGGGCGGFTGFPPMGE